MYNTLVSRAFILSVLQLQSLAADGREAVSSSHSDYSLKVESNGTLATGEGLSPAQLSFAQEVFLPIVYLLVVLVVFFRCTVLFSGDAWFYKRKTVRKKMESIRCCTSQTNSREEAALLSEGTESEGDADSGTSPPEPHANADNTHSKALMRNISMILAFQILATCLSLCLGREVIIHCIEVFPSAFAEPVKAVCLIAFWIVALLALCVITICYTCVQQCRHSHLNLCGTCCIMPVCFSNCCCCCLNNKNKSCLTDLFSSVVDVVLTIGTVHFLAYVTSVSLLFLLTSFLRNWLPTFYIIVTNVSCFTILLVALSEVTYLFLKVKLDKPSPRSKKWKCLMAVSHRAVVFLLFIVLSVAMCFIYLHPIVLYNHLSTSPMFTPVVTMAATSLAIYTLIRRYHIIPFNKDARKYITN